jgi:parallel beta-helix repeat protein
VDEGPGLGWSENITIRDCVAFDNHRQGISVISAVNLLVENCTFANTSGTAPESGVDIEPDTPRQRLVNILFKNCVFEDNHGHEIALYLKQMDHTTEPVSIRFEHCLSRQTDPSVGGWSGMTVGAIRDDGPKGLIEFVDCVSENTGEEGAKIYDKSANGALVRFVRCKWSNPWTSPHPEHAYPRVPVLIQLRRPSNTTHLGGVEFEDCYVYDHVYRAALQVEEDGTEYGVRDVHGLITVQNPSGARMRLGHAPVNADVQVAPAPPQPAPKAPNP